MRTEYERDAHRYLRHLKRSERRLRWKMEMPDIKGYKHVVEFRTGMAKMAAEIGDERVERGI